MSEKEVERNGLYRKLLIRIVPYLLLLYFICYIDRVNIGFAKLQFLGDLGLNDSHFGFATSLFFVTYSLFDIPSNLMAARIGVRKTLLRIMVLWGLLTAAQMFVRTANELYILRLLFGAAEAGFVPGIMLYLTYWFPDRYRGRVTSLFLLGIPVSGIIGGPISGLIMQHMNDVAGLRGWQWLFLLQGIPAIAFGVLSYFYLDDKPSDASWLNKAEREAIVADLHNDSRDREQKHKGRLSAFKDPFLYVLMAINFCVNCGIAAMAYWTPTLLREAGYSNVADIGWLSGCISLVTGVVMLLVGRSSDRHQERRWHLAACAVTAALALLFMPLVHENKLAMTLLTAIASIATVTTFTVYWFIPTSYFRGPGKAGGIAAASMIGAVGSATAPSLIGWLKVETGSIFVGLAIIAAILIAGMLLALICVPREQNAEAETAFA